MKLLSCHHLLAGLIMGLGLTSLACGDPAEPFDATPQRADSSVLPFDAGSSDRQVNDLNRPDTTRPDNAVADTARPDTARPDVGPTDTARPDTAGQDTARPDTSTTSEGGAPDNASTGDSGGSCGTIDIIGRCDGTVLSYCNEGQVETYDCAEMQAGCGLVDCTGEDCWGYDCVAPLNGACGPGREDLRCDIALEHGCRGGICTASDTCEEASYVENCADDLYMYCPTGRIWDFDCTFGGTAALTCGDNSQGAASCLGLEGARCDPAQGGECVPNLDCVDGVCRDTSDAGAPDTSVAVDAARPDSSATPDAGGGCGNVTFIGACEADTLLYCSNGELRSADCGNSGATCGLVDCVDPTQSCWGYDCVAPVGGACGLGDSSRKCDVSETQGCLGGVCAASSVCDPATHSATCSGAVLTYCPTPYDVIWDFDCSSGGTNPYTCGARSDGRNFCLGELNASCDLSRGLECVSGLVCSFGYCGYF